jgi:DNA primase
MSVSQDIESRIDILELASRYVTLKKTGANYKGLSPFKAEKTPSFVVSPAKNIAYCFGTHRGGGPIKFLMEVENLEYREALEILAKQAGVELKTGYRERERDEGGDIYDLHKAAKEYYYHALRKPEHADKMQYLLDRGITAETIDRFELGFADGGKPHWANLKSRGFGDKMLLESGIFSGPGRDKFTGRIVFPLCNFTGHPVGFTGRILGAGEPKYLNSPASHIFDKSSILYGLHLAKSEITKADKVVIVEGQMDTVALHQAGYRYAVGISGSALTREQIRMLRRLTKNLYLCLDTDRAGVMATFASIENMVNEDVNLSVIRVE